jgi:hypothetical protein
VASDVTKLFEFARRRAPVPARKAAPSTSYQAKGLVPTTPPKTDTELGSSQPIRIQEVVPELNSPFVRQQTYAKMMNDAAVDVSMRAAKTPILGAEFFVKPASDDPLDMEIAEFIVANLMEGMSAPFLNSLEDILHMYEDGYSVAEKVYERRNWAPKQSRSGANTKQFVMLKKLGIRPISTIQEIEYDDNGGPVRIIHNAIQADKTVEEKKLEISKVVIFTFNKQGGNVEGKSLLRTAYPHWYYKTHMYKIDAIQKERHSLGIPRGKILSGFKPTDRPILQRLLRNLRSNEESFFIELPTFEIDFVKPEGGGELPDALESATHHNGMIMMNVLGQFIVMGTAGGNSGGRATAGTQADMFMKSLKYVANYICQCINMYIIPELVVWNYPTNRFPKLQVRNIGETRDLQMLASALGNLFSQKALTPDLETENQLRDVFDLISKPAGSYVQPTDVKTEVPVEGKSNGKSKGSIKPGAIKSGYVGQPPAAAD